MITLGGVMIARRRPVWSATSTVSSSCRAPNVRAVGAELKAIADKEAKMEPPVKSGATYPAWLDDVLKSDRVRYLD